MDRWTRRKFFATTLAGSALAGAERLFANSLPSNGESPEAAELFAPPDTGAKRPVIISSANGVNALGKGMDILKSGGDTLEAVVAAVTIVEDDPNDDSVGYGGLPNEEGVVELDASVMHGPTRPLAASLPSSASKMSRALPKRSWNARTTSCLSAMGGARSRWVGG